MGYAFADIGGLLIVILPIGDDSQYTARHARPQVNKLLTLRVHCHNAGIGRAGTVLDGALEEMAGWACGAGEAAHRQPGRRR